MSSSARSSSAALLIGLLFFDILAVFITGTGVTIGVVAGRLHPALGFAGVGTLGFAGVLGAVLGSAERPVPHLHGPIALVTMGLILATGFLFGPTSLIVAAGVPFAGGVAVRQLGRGWGIATLMFGIFGAFGLWGLGLLGWLPNGVAYLEHPPADPVIGAMQLAATLVGAAFALAIVEPHAPHPEGASPRRRARTGTLTREDIARIDRRTLQEDVTPDILTPEAHATLEAQKLESLGVLAGGIAHDFNNLLVGILGNASVARMSIEGQADPAPLREIETAATRARELVAQLLAYAGKGTLAPGPLDLNQLVAEMGDLLATASRVQLSFDFSPVVPMMVADATQIRQVVMNLITNASDAMEGSGEIRVQTGVRRVETGELVETLLGRACEPGRYVVLTVTDGGSGMDEGTLTRIFDPFFTTRKSGRGLGLAAVLGIVRRSGGTMSVESELDVGTVFTLYFPLAERIDEDEDLPTEHTTTAQGWSPAETGVFLVIDDDPLVRKVTVRMVRRLDFEVVEAEDGESGLARFLDVQDDVIAVLVDMSMPGMNGVETVSAIRQHRPGIPAIITSGYSESDIPSTDAVFLQKPYTVKQLTQCIDEVLVNPRTS